jgi:calcineurin-like phosphoesterase family protein
MALKNYDLILHGEPVWFTSDTHFGHARIIEMNGRPFNDVETMDKTLIDNWNERIGQDDIVFHLGDFAFGNTCYWDSILEQLNGRIYLVWGNHDRKYCNRKHNYPKIVNIADQMVLNIKNRTVILNHYPFLCYAGTYRPFQTYQFFGHVHTSKFSHGQDIPRLEYLFPTQYDVGVDNNKYKPISFNEIDEIIRQRYIERR